LIYAIWSCEALGSLQIDIASPHQISLCPLLHVDIDFFPFARCEGAKTLAQIESRQFRIFNLYVRTK